MGTDHSGSRDVRTEDVKLYLDALNVCPLYVSVRLDIGPASRRPVLAHRCVGQPTVAGGR
jgi:hypothetical protein